MLFLNQCYPGWSPKKYHNALRGFTKSMVADPSLLLELKQQPRDDPTQPTAFPCDISKAKSQQVPTSGKQAET